MTVGGAGESEGWLIACDWCCVCAGGLGRHGVSLGCINGSFHGRSLPPEHIQQIMTLEESVQHVVMTAIQEVRISKFLFDMV